MDDYGLETVQEYMYHIRNNAEMSVRNLLKDVVERAGTNELSAIDYLDDGSPVNFFLADFRIPESYARFRSRSKSKSTRKKDQLF